MSDTNCPNCGASAWYRAVDGTKKYDCGALVTPEIVRFCEGARRKSPHDEGKPTALVHKALYDTVERERDDLQKAINGLCDHLGVNPANTTLLAVEVLKIIRERDDAREKYTTLLTENMFAVHSLHKKLDNAVAVADELAKIASLCLGQTLSSIKSNTDENNLKQADKITRALEQWKKLKKEKL